MTKREVAYFFGVKDHSKSKQNKNSVNWSKFHLVAADVTSGSIQNLWIVVCFKLLRFRIELRGKTSQWILLNKLHQLLCETSVAESIK